MRIQTALPTVLLASVVACAGVATRPVPQSTAQFTIGGRMYDPHYRTPHPRIPLELIEAPVGDSETADACLRAGRRTTADDEGYFEYAGVVSGRRYVLCTVEHPTLRIPVFSISVASIAAGDTLFLTCSLHTGEHTCVRTTRNNARR